MSFLLPRCSGAASARVNKSVVSAMNSLPVACRRTVSSGKTQRLTKVERARMQDTMAENARAMEKNFTREWKTGDVYAPHDLSAAEARKWKKKYSPTTDAFDALNLNPLSLYKNFSVMSEYITEMGKIRPQTSTGLRKVNQRKLSKAIRRAVALGLMPSVHRHPELLQIERQKRESFGRIFL